MKMENRLKEQLLQRIKRKQDRNKPSKNPEYETSRKNNATYKQQLRLVMKQKRKQDKKKNMSKTAIKLTLKYQNINKETMLKRTTRKLYRRKEETSQLVLLVLTNKEKLKEQKYKQRRK